MEKPYSRYLYFVAKNNLKFMLALFEEQSKSWRNVVALWDHNINNLIYHLCIFYKEYVEGHTTSSSWLKELRHAKFKTKAMLIATMKMWCTMNVYQLDNRLKLFLYMKFWKDCLDIWEKASWQLAKRIIVPL